MQLNIPHGPKHTLRNYTESLDVEILQVEMNVYTKGLEIKILFNQPNQSTIDFIGPATYQKLADSIFSLEEDGKFGKLTAGRVAIYQDRNNLKVDGIVGRLTWSSLQGINNRVRKRVLGVRRKTPNLHDALQKNPRGTDCGFFAAYAVAQTVKKNGNVALLRFNSGDVLKARDEKAVLAISDEYKGKERTGGAYLSSWDAAEYLENLGAWGYKRMPVTVADKKSSTSVVNYLSDRTQNGTAPLIMSLSMFGGSLASGHWIAILSVQLVSKFPLYLIYDSSGVLPNGQRKNGYPAGKATAWLLASELASVMKIRVADFVISRQ